MKIEVYQTPDQWIGSGSGHCTGFGTDFVHLDGRLMQDLVHPAVLLRDHSAQIGFGLIKRIADSLGFPESLEIDLRAESETWQHDTHVSVTKLAHHLGRAFRI